MSKNQTQLLAAVERAVDYLKAEGKSLKESKQIIYGILLQHKREIDNDNVAIAMFKIKTLYHG